MRIVIQLCGGLLFFLLLIASAPTALHAAPLNQTGITTTLTVDDIGDGSVTAQPTGPVYNYGDTVTLIAMANEGSTFAGWSGDLTPPEDWFAPLWAYRVPLNVGANGYPRTERPLEITIDFAALLGDLGVAAPFDPNSLRVVELNSSAQIIDNNVPFQLDDPAGDGAGTLVLLLTGTTAANQGRTYHLYFDVVGKGFSAPVFTDLVTLASIGNYQGPQDTLEIATSNTTYRYHTKGGGFASLNDSDGRDWISYRKNVSGAGGTFRGIPNMIYPEGKFHPGDRDSTTSVVSSGPLKETIRTETNDGKWEAIWEFFPTFARMTVLKADHNYWFLYEGTPGGSFDPDSDFIVRADGTQTLLSETWQADLAGDEWVYVGDPNRGRSLFLAHHTNDSQVESYKPADNLMTVFGFGRKNTPPPVASTLSQIPDSFTIGLVDETTYLPMARAIQAAYKDLVAQMGTPQQRGQHQPTIPSTNSTVTFAMTSDRALTATFAPLDYTLDLQTVGNGTVGATPQSPYHHGDQVTLTATPAVGWRFDDWSGDLGGATTPRTITMDANKVITANFARIAYEIDLTIIGDGTVQKAPNQSTYFFDDVVTLTATPDAGWHFVGWEGDRTSSQTPLQITVQDDLSITATFAQNQYTVTPTTIGKGSVALSPVQDTYVYREQVTLTATPDTGWQFDGWQGDLISTTNLLPLSITGNTAVTAKFSQKVYTLITVVEAGGTIAVTPDTTSYLHGTAVTLTANPEPGWRFVGWQGDATGAANPLTLIMDRSKSVEAQFERIAYNVTVNQAAGGTITWTPMQEHYSYGDEITFTATPDAEMTFTGWRGALSGDQTPVVLTVRDNLVVSAAFTAMPLKVTTAKSGQGEVTVAPLQENYQPGDQVVLQALPATGWLFAGWTGDVTATTTPLTLTLDSDINITANFVEATYPVTVIPAASGGTIAATPQKAVYAFGEGVTLTATPAPGFRFVRWILTPDVQGASMENPLTIQVDKALSITAEFTDGAPIYQIFLPIVTQE